MEEMDKMKTIALILHSVNSSAHQIISFVRKKTSIVIAVVVINFFEILKISLVTAAKCLQKPPT